MKQKKSKNIQISEGILKQHKKAKTFELNLTAPEITFKSMKDIRKYIFKNLPFILLLALFIGALYYNSLKGGFVSDDIAEYLKNETIRDIKNAFHRLYWQDVLYALNYKFFQINPTPLHIVSVFFHFTAAVAFFLFISNFFSKKVAYFSTFLFATHPLASEAVNWISANNYLLIATLTFLTLIFYVLYKNTDKKRYLITSGVIYTLGFLFIRAVQLITVFPVLLVVDQFFFEKKLNFKGMLKLWPYVIPLILFFAYLGADTSRRFETITAETAGKTSFLISLPYSIFMTIKLMFYPDMLTLYHDAEIITNTLLSIMRVTTIGFAISIIYFWKKSRKIAALLLMGLASIFYMLSPIQVSWFFAERYVYFALSLFTTLLALIFLSIEKKVKLKHLGLILVILLTAAYSFRTYVRNKDWLNRKTLWESTARVVPYSARTYNNLGDVYGKEGDFEKSIQAFEKAVELDPTYSHAYHNLGYAHLTAGNLDEAQEFLEKSLALDPTIPQSHYHLGIVAYERQDYKKALEYAKKAAELDPNFTKAQTMVDYIEANH